MAFTMVSEELWSEVEPLLPKAPDRPKGGRPRLSNRACFTGIVFVLRTGMPWRFIPKELGCGSGVSCWRRLREWTRSGVWPRVMNRLLRELHAEHLLEPSLGIVDSQSVRAVLGGNTPGKTRRIAAKKAANVTC
jgi:transposase